MRSTVLAIVAIAAVLTGCAAPLSSFQTARTTPKGEFDMHVGLGANVSPTLINSLSDLGDSAADKAKNSVDNGETPDLTDEDIQNLFGSVIATALFLPLPIFEVGLRYGILDFWDLGAVFTSAGWRLETKFGVLSQLGGDPLDVSVGLVGMRQTFKPPLSDAAEAVITLEEMKRTDIMIPALAGYHVGDWLFVYGGPKLVYTDLELGIVEQVSEASENALNVDDNMLMIGGVAGFGIGYDVVFLQLEINALYYTYSAELLGTQVDVGGLDLYPAGGLRFEFY